MSARIKLSLEIKEQSGARGVEPIVHIEFDHIPKAVHDVGDIGGGSRGRCPVVCSATILPCWRCVTTAYISIRIVRYCKITG